MVGVLVGKFWVLGQRKRSNRVSKNEETDANEGKGDWFPLAGEQSKGLLGEPL